MWPIGSQMFCHWRPVRQIVQMSRFTKFLSDPQSRQYQVLRHFLRTIIGFFEIRKGLQHQNRQMFFDKWYEVREWLLQISWNLASFRPQVFSKHTSFQRPQALPWTIWSSFSESESWKTLLTPTTTIGAFGREDQFVGGRSTEQMFGYWTQWRHWRN